MNNAKNILTNRNKYVLHYFIAKQLNKKILRNYVVKYNFIRKKFLVPMYNSQNIRKDKK